MASSYHQTSANYMQDFEVNTLNAKILKPLDEALRCHICFEYFTNCMITKCSHNYCSVCIRRYMNYKSQCPTCFQEAVEPELQNNRLIDEILRIYKKIRETLQIPCDSVSVSFPEQSTSSKSVKIESREKHTQPETSAQSTSNEQSEVIASDEVSCPVCYATVPSDRINIHLDSCLKQTEERNERKFLPKLVYHLLSDKDLKKKLKEHGLSSTGSRPALIRRHKNFVTLFNANCDSLNPKPVSDLLLEIERQELEERLNASQRRTQVNKRSDPSLIEKEHETYLEEHKTQFEALIEDVQQRFLAERYIKQEIDITETTSNLTDESGNLIGEQTLEVGNVLDFEPVIVKEEPPDYIHENTHTGYNDDDHDQNITIKTEPNADFSNTSQLPFRVKKDVSSKKIKNEPQFLLDSTTNQDCAIEKPAPLEDFEKSKISVNKFHKKKNARKLSTEEKNSQRKK